MNFNDIPAGYFTGIIEDDDPYSYTAVVKASNPMTPYESFGFDSYEHALKQVKGDRDGEFKTGTFERREKGMPDVQYVTWKPAGERARWRVIGWIKRKEK